MRTLALVMALVLPLSASGKEWPVARGPANEPNPQPYSAADWKNVPVDFLEDSPACYLRSANSFLIEADGTVETITHEIIRLNSRKAIEHLGEHRSMIFNPAYEKLTLHEALIHKPDGTKVPVEPKHVQLRDTQTDFLVYDTGKQLIVSFPTLGVGDVLEIRWTVRGKNPEYAGQYFSRYQFGDDKYPVYRDELRVQIAEKQPFRHALINPKLLPGGKLAPVIVKKDGKILYSWLAKERRAPAHDERMPSKEESRPGVAFSTFATWDSVGDWIRKIHAECWECTADLKKIVADVTRGCTTPEAKAKALTHWFRGNIRYVSTGEKHDYIPHSPAVVLANRYGDCKDGAQFLVVLFKEAGIRAAVASLSVRGDGQVMEDLPSPAASHAIVVATIDGKEHWVDTTCTLAGWDQLPYSDCDRVTYIVDEKTTRLSRTPKLTANGNRSELTTTMYLNGDGSADVVRNSVFSGLAALNHREEWVDEPTGERRRAIASDLQEAHSRTRLRRVEIDEAKLRDLDGPVTARFYFVVTDQLRGKPDLEGSVGDSSIWSHLLGVSLDLDRETPLELDRPFESTHTYTIHAPLGYRLVDPPATENTHSKWGTFQRRVEASEGGQLWTIRFHTVLERTRIDPEEFEQFRQFQERVQREYRAAVTLRPVQNEEEISDDIGFLEFIAMVTPADKQAGTTLAKLYQETGKKADAFRVAQRLNYFYPNEREFLTFLARNSEGDAIEPAYRTLMKLAPDEAELSLELGRKLTEAKQYDRANAVLKPLTEKGVGDDRRAEAYLLVAKIQLAQSLSKEALASFEKAEKLDPAAVETFSARMMRGRAFLATDDGDAAAESFKAALAVNERSEEALVQLIELYAESVDNPIEALHYVHLLQNAAGDDVGKKVLAANWFIKLGHIDEAAEVAEPLAGAKPTSAVHRLLGIIAARRTKWSDAGKHLSEVAMEEQDTLFRDACVDWALATGDLAKVLKYTKAIRESGEKTDIDPAEVTTRRKEIVRDLPPESVAKHAKAIDAYLCAELAHQTNQADLVAPLLAMIPDDAEIGPAFALRSILALEAGKLRKAIPDAETAIRLSPKEARGYYARGRIRYETRQKDATADLRKAVELSDSKEAMMLHWLATSLLADGKINEAIKFQKLAIELDPDHPEILEQLKALEKLR